MEPEIHRHDEIGLKMSLEVSSLVSVIKTASGSQAYQIGTRNVTTSLRLRDGETQVLAGLISDADRSSANKVPLVGELPLLGRLFSSQKDDRTKTEIVMSITPHLVRNVRRKDPSAESFWSGTEANLRTRALVLGSFSAADATAGAAVGSAAQTRAADAPAAGQAAVVAAEVKPNTSGIALQWADPIVPPIRNPYRFEIPYAGASLNADFNGSGYNSTVIGFTEMDPTTIAPFTRADTTICLSTGRGLDCGVRTKF